jgi:thiamine-phosphate pyrophosphorylase
LTPADARCKALAGLHVLADDAPRWSHDPVEQARAACAGGAAVVQLRAKHTTDAETLRMARAIRQLTTRAGVLFFMNDRFDLALAADADGVHLGQDDLPPGRIPAVSREQLLIGRSTHTEAQLRAAADEPVDYLAFGPVFGTQSKVSEWSPRGIEALAHAARAAAPRPLIAIGGIGPSNIAKAGSVCAGAAVISAVAGEPQMEAATRALVGALADARPSAP